MCGRFALTDPLQILIEKFLIDDVQIELNPSYNIAPGTQIPAIILNENKRQLKTFFWGFIPHWQKKPSLSKTLINTRSETAYEKPTFRDAFAKRRCLIPANGFFEWQKEDGGKHPMYIKLQLRDHFTLAGIYEEIIYPGKGEMSTCAILTTNANKAMEPVHNRMPVILLKEHENLWLDTSTPIEEIKNILIPSEEILDIFKVSKIVNSPKNNFPQCIEPI